MDETTNLSRVKRVITVLSGKGGVGKSSVSVQLAVALALAGKKVGLLDVDLCGPSIPRMLNLAEERIRQGADGWQPVTLAHGQCTLRVMSMGFLLPNRDDAIVWRGPKKASMIRQFLFNVDWQELDYLIVDTPPGTSDEHIAIAEYLASYRPQAIVVTTPQLVALADVERELGFCRQVDMPVLGVVENMSGYLCPHCAECTNIFSREGGRLLAEKYSLPFLGRIPIAPQLARLVEDPNANLLADYPTRVPELYSIFAGLGANV